MDALVSKADAIRPVTNKRKRTTGPKRTDHHEPDKTLASISKSTLVPRSLRPRTDSPPPPGTKAHTHIKNPALRLRLARQSEHTARSRQLVRDAAFLTDATGAVETGAIETEGDLEKTWRLTQKEIAESVGEDAKRGRREWKLDGGPYVCRYTRNGRHMIVAGKTGHVASFDWRVGTLHAEIQLKESCRDVTYLHDQSHFAVAQKKYVYIYDKNGVELHRLTDHIEPTRLEYLPHHWLLVSIGLPGRLTYHDTSTGQLLAQHRTALGPSHSLCQNPHSAVIHTGHTNGTVSLWTPNLSSPIVRLQAHLGNVTSLGVDPSSDGGRYLATAGCDGLVKVWDCRNWKGVVREWRVRSGASGGAGAEVEWSGKGYLAVSAGGAVNIYSPPTIHTPPPSSKSNSDQTQKHRTPPPLYLTHPLPHRPLQTPRFCPYTDILTVPHASGLSSVLVPGAGVANFDSREADPFESGKERREREVRGLLEKVEGGLVGVGEEQVGGLVVKDRDLDAGADLGEKRKAIGVGAGVNDVPYARLKRWERLRVSGKMDETEEGRGENGDDDVDGVAGTSEEARNADREKREKMKMRGKGKSMKRYLRKQRKNVIDPAALAIRAKLDKMRAVRRAEVAKERGDPLGEGGGGEKTKSALDRFKRRER